MAPIEWLKCRRKEGLVVARQRCGARTSFDSGPARWLRIRSAVAPTPLKRVPLVLLVLASGLVSVASGSGRPAQDPAEGTYLRAVEAFRRCNDPDAFRLLATVPPTYLFSIARIERERMPLTSDSDRALALLMHTRALHALPSDGQLEHRRVASHLAELLITSERMSSELTDLTHGLLAIQLQEEGRIVRLVQLFARLPAAHRRSPRALLATASLHGLLSTPMVSLDSLVGPLDEALAGARQPPPPLDEWGRVLVRSARASKRTNWERSVLLFREVAAIWPSDAEAYLRLAQLLIEEGQLSEASAALKAAAGLDKPTVLMYLEALLRARLAERQGQTDSAHSAYDAAGSMFPSAPTPALAMARLDFLAGRADVARDALRSELGGSSSPVNDPRWELLLGQTWRREEYLQRFERLVRSCGS